ncbi:hypothetical protein [Mycobacterium sp. 236(2023)]|uniref:hypothetical protein n=1 Tax=Mycobacterium sp. 236(2023) TaxID=3038163 RepID=UPI002415846E|nr:hypothetical protein [Mycobacterium sp. 236(2023)]MDG4668638.1 hypothetical protein [Mycobacterium sp. 236(2023)]
MVVGLGAALALVTISACSSEQSAPSEVASSDAGAPMDHDGAPMEGQFDTPASAIPAAVPPACPWSDAEFGRLIAPMFPGASVESEDIVPSSGGYAKTVCVYDFGPDNSLTVLRYLYSDNAYSNVGVYDVDRNYGGTSAQEVYATTVKAYTDVNAAAGGGAGVSTYPDIGEGFVVDKGSTGVLAIAGAYWVQFDLRKGRMENQSSEDLLVAVATQFPPA